MNVFGLQRIEDILSLPMADLRPAAQVPHVLPCTAPL